MADETEKQDEQKQDEQKQQDEQKAAAPQYVPADEFKTFQATIQGTMDAVRESLQALNSSRVHEPARPDAAIEDVTDEEIDAVLAEGKGAKVFRKMLDAATKRLDKKYEARASHIEETASNSLSSMASELAKPKMKHYNKDYIKKQVDAYLARMPIEQRLDPTNHLVVYNAVVGENNDRIVAEEVEAALRKAKNPAGVLPGGSNGRTNDSPVEATVKEVFGDEAERELRSRGRSIESIAKAFGMSKEDYIKLARDTEGEGTVQ
jgi:hypothetical protein